MPEGVWDKEAVSARLAHFGTVVLTLIAATAMTACSSLRYPDAGKALSQFPALPDNAQVRYAPGAASYARQVATVLHAATRQIEALHQRPFLRPPVVHVCNDDACFHRFVAARWNFTAAVVYDNHLLLAPRLFYREAERLTPILLHELSHLHMGQYRGHYTMAIPVWFHEGLASLVAHGGGADLATDADAWRSAVAGRHFAADQQHLPWKRTRADAWGISISVFYRQAMLYLEHLRSRDPAAFRRLLHALQDGQDFDAAFAEAYQTNPGHAVHAFFSCVDEMLRETHPLCAPRADSIQDIP
jgi:hypothetical protein